nr:FeoC-like transcriptional regulator [uncultured Oscillibacter sp.]
MTELLELMRDGRAWSLEDLAQRLNTTPDQVKRQMEFLEQMGYLRRVGGCGHDCKGCSAHCGAGAELAGMPVFWELTRP